MKRLFMALAICLMIAGLTFAQETTTTEEETSIFKIDLKQGLIKPYKGGKIQHLTTFATMQTTKIDSWGKWNVLWDGWVVDAGFSYSSGNLDNVAVLLGREFGTLGKYLPIDFPLAKYVKITIYPIGSRINDPFNEFKEDKVYGLAYIKGEIRF